MTVIFDQVGLHTNLVNTGMMVFQPVPIVLRHYTSNYRRRMIGEVNSHRLR